MKSELLSHFQAQFYQELLTPKTFMKSELLSHFQAQFLQEWDAEIVRNRRCVAYRIFKDNCFFQSNNEFVFQPYLSYLSYLDRRALSKFRSGSHTLPVTKSRYRDGGGGVDVKCKFCDEDLCDEFHVLFVCKFFEEQRIRYLKKYYFVRPSTLKMHNLFNANRKVTINLAKFVRYILSKF